MTTEQQIEENDNQEDDYKNYPRPGEKDYGNRVAAGLIIGTLLVVALVVTLAIVILK